MTQPRNYDKRNMKRLRVTRNSLKRLLPSTGTPLGPLSVLHDELIREMLLRLLARSLLRYKKFGDFSVRCMFENPSQPIEVIRFAGKSSHEIIGSCNGLLCLQDITDMDNLIMLWNPSTGLTSQPLEIRDFIGVCGFGYDHVNDEYKFVAVVDQIQKQDPLRSETRIHTFCPNPSKRIIQDTAFKRIIGDGKGVFVPGTATLNWIHWHGTLDYLVLSLDLVEETYSEFSLPLNLKAPKNKFFIFPPLCVLKNCLAFCCSHEKTHWSVRLLKEYVMPQSWTRLATIHCHPSLLTGAELHPLYIRENTLLMAMASTSKIVMSNLDDGGLEFPLLKPTPSDVPMGLRFYIYHETLVSPSYRCPRSSSSQIWFIKP
ncbi:F-box/kelch-repeat protein At3g23880-like [Arachis duranensis]|uniref:F-box/kelch-repeat protein At3g23880-like n=1 Tax=Arachis duranensis TaxID=130453 RepID=A0A9C6TQ43_ARADU|nr:F-box/kelch-repeat protein At3g23880-like [Arachis duranensis]QHO59131.1 F-box/kelch-repeat protein [Arachis hypogaea]